MRIDSITVGVADVAEAARWYESVLGLAPRAGGEPGTARLGCGARAEHDLELRAGSGLLAVTYRTVPGELEVRRAALEAAGAAVADRGDGLAVTMPNGVEVRLVPGRGESYAHATEWDGAGAGSPRELDHVTVSALDVDANVAVATAGLGLAISDIQRHKGRDAGVWMRAGERHHDYAVARGRRDGLHHLAYQVTDAADLVRFADRIVRLGHRSEYGIGRHGPGSNLFLYVRDPSGNRVELCCDMAVVPPGAPARVWEGNDDRFLDVWASYLPPPTWSEVT